MKRYITLAIFCFFSSALLAQQNPMQNYYIFNHMVINPAYVGTKMWTTVNFNATAQWIGLEGAPRTQVLAINGPVFKSNGLGISLINDKLGAQTQQSVLGSFSHILRLNETWKLSMGISAGFKYNTLDGTKLISDEQDDQSINRNSISSMRFDSQTGLFLYSKKSYFGFSVANLLNTDLKNQSQNSINDVRHFYMTFGHVFDLSENFKLKPSILIREDLKAQTNIDLNTFLLYKELVWVGATYRIGTSSVFNKKLDASLHRSSALAFFLEWSINQKFNIGYAYTLSTSSLMKYSGHEIQLSYIFPKKKETRVLSPRYF